MTDREDVRAVSLRQKINGNPAVIAAFAVVLIGITGWFSFKSIRGSGAPYIPTQAYFSSDDGKTWFADDKKKAPPFKAADGKDAVQAVVVSCKGGKDRSQSSPAGISGRPVSRSNPSGNATRNCRSHR